MKRDIILLDRNENQYGPAPECMEILKNAGKSELSIYSKSYKINVKSFLSDRIAKDHDIEEARVILGYGCEDLLKQTVQCYLGKGEKLLVPTHSWWYYKAIAEEVGAGNVEYPIVEREESYAYDVDELLRLYNEEKTKVVFISSPNNPTGNSLAHSDLVRILDEIKDAVVVYDEAYLHEDTHELTRDLINKYPNFLVLRTFSKLYALAGARIGYGLLGANLTELAKLSNRYLGFNRLSEDIAIAALDSSDYYNDISKKMALDKEMYYRELNALPGFKVFKSDANFILAKIPAYVKTDMNKFLVEKGIVIKFMNEEILNCHVRITIGTQEQNRIVVDAIKEFMAEHAKEMV